MPNKHICIIPAKSGSTRLPNKNFLPFYGNDNLTEIAINFAKKLGFNKIYVSTEDEGKFDELQRFLKAKSINDVKVDIRHPELATDPATIKDVVVDILSRYYPIADGIWVKTVTVILPTSPINDVSCLKQGLQLAKDNRDKRILSVVKNSKPPFNSWSFLSDDDALMENTFSKSEFARTQSTRCPDTYISNGCFTIWNIDKNNSITENGTLGIEMPPICSVDIDDELEFEIAQFLFDKLVNCKSNYKK